MKSDLITMVKNLTVDKVALQHENKMLRDKIRHLEHRLLVMEDAKDINR